MVYLKKGQHYDRELADATALIHTIRQHLEEDECNHSLREIVEDGLK